MPALASLHHYLCHPSHTNISIKSVPSFWKIGRKTSIMLAIMLEYNKSGITQIFRTSARKLKRIMTLWLAPYEYKICTTFLLFRALARIVLLKDDSIDRSLHNTESPLSSKPYKTRRSVARSLCYRNMVLEENTSLRAQDIPKTKILIPDNVMDFLTL